MTVVTVSTKWEHLPAQLTATMMESYPPDSGSSEMKSTLMTSQRSSGIGSGWSSPVGRRRCILVQRHKSQWETYGHFQRRDWSSGRQQTQFNVLKNTNKEGLTSWPATPSMGWGDWPLVWRGTWMPYAICWTNIVCFFHLGAWEEIWNTLRGIVHHDLWMSSVVIFSD